MGQNLARRVGRSRKVVAPPGFEPAVMSDGPWRVSDVPIRPVTAPVIVTADAAARMMQ